MLSQPEFLKEGLDSILDDMTDSGDPPWRVSLYLGIGVEIGWETGWTVWTGGEGWRGE